MTIPHWTTVKGSGKWRLVETTCRNCPYYRIIGHTYGSCEAGDNRVVKFDEECSDVEKELS